MPRRLYLDTRDSNFISIGNNNADVQFLLPDVTSMLATHYSVELIDCSIPVTVYPFVSGRNTTVVFTENGGADQTFEITPGTYSGQELADHLATELTATGALSYNGTYSDITKKITLFTTLPDTFTIESDSTCLNEIGFTSAAETTAVTHTGANVVNLLGTRYVDIVCNFNTQSVAPHGRHNVLHRVHIDQPMGGVVFYKNNFDKPHITTSAESLRQIELRLYDEEGRLYQVPDNHRITYTLELTPLD